MTDPFNPEHYPTLQYSVFINKHQLVIRAASVAEIARHMSELREPFDPESPEDTESVMSVILNATESLTAAGFSSALSTSAQTPPPSPTNRSATQDDPNGPPMCSCGAPRKYRYDKQNNPPTWSAWYCPRRENQCNPRSIKVIHSPDLIRFG